jgi:phenylpropionate dioxygenase-like ring-hydroxylating dioxygenase large terminal subunit
VAAEADVVSGRLLAASAGGVPVLLTRAPDGTPVVLADRCTHRGAPLHEGELRDGCIVCPWHGSEFALGGSVVRGPATRPQAAYEVQVVDGRVLVRRADEPRTLRTNPVS